MNKYYAIGGILLIALAIYVYMKRKHEAGECSCKKTTPATPATPATDTPATSTPGTVAETAIPANDNTTDTPEMLVFKPTANVANAFKFTTINGKCYYRKDEYSDWMHCENITDNNAGVNIRPGVVLNQNIVAKTASANLLGTRSIEVPALAL